MNGHGENSNLHFLCRAEVFFRKKNSGFSKKTGQGSGALVAHHFFSRSHSKIWHDAEIKAKIPETSWATKSWSNSCSQVASCDSWFATLCKNLVIVKIRHKIKHSQSTWVLCRGEAIQLLLQLDLAYYEQWQIPLPSTVCCCAAMAMEAWREASRTVSMWFLNGIICKSLGCCPYSRIVRK